MSYENPTTVVDTESAKIRAAGMASFGQSIGGAITALGQRQREEAKETKKANKAFLNSQTKYNAEYQKNSWLATDDYKEDAGFDISPQENPSPPECPQETQPLLPPGPCAVREVR